MNSTDDKWLKSTEHKPPFDKSVWGLFKGRSVELCQLALTRDEYQNYFDHCEAPWYSHESEKSGVVTYWTPCKRPNKKIE